MNGQETELEPRLLEACARAGQINEDNLRRLLADNRDTVFGKKYGFGPMETSSEYRKKVPLSSYASLQPYLDRMAQGEQKVLTAYPAAGFLRTSGTEGGSKKIPVTFASLERYSDQIEWYKNLAHKKAGGKRLSVNGFRVELMQEKKEYLLSELYYQYLFRNGFLSFDDFAGGEETMFGQNGRDILYAKVWTAFAVEEITSIESIFLYDQLLFFRYLQRHWRRILRHMRKKRIPEGIGLTERTKAKLLEMPVCEQRLRRVEEECKAGFDGIAGRLWPGLSLASGIGGKSFETEDGSLRRFLGKTPVYYFSYVASECHMGVALRPEECRYVMLPESAFYEYLPWPEREGEGAEETLLPGQVRPGELYEPVLTTFSGLYRYRTGDVVRVTGFLGESPMVEFVLRKNLFLNVAGEKMSVYQAERAVSQLAARYGLPVQSYCIGRLSWEAPACYGAVFGLEEPAAGEPAEEKKTAGRLDRALTAQNPDYLDLRRLGCLGRPQVICLSPEEYEVFLEELGMTGGHGKPRHAAGAVPEPVWKKWKEISSGRRKE